MPDEQLLTVDEVAARLRVDPETVRRMLRDGRLDGVRAGGRKAGWRVTESALAAFWHGRRTAKRYAAAATTTPPPPTVPISERTAVLVANMLDQAERARARGDEDGALQFERMAAEAASAEESA